MSPKFLIASAGLLAALSAHASLSVGSSAFTYGQTFDSLATTGATNPWVNDSTLAGWSIFNGTTALTTYRASTGADNAGAAYSFGSAADRALGTVASGTVANPTLALSFTNNSGAALDSFTLHFDGEQWRNGGNTAVQQLTVQYGFGSSFAGVTSWTNAGAGFDVKSIVNTATAAAVNGNVAGLSANLGGTISTNWAAGDTLWIRWNDVNDVGNDHGLAIDNLSFSVTAVPEPSTYAMLLAGIGAIGFMARRRRA
ncbi:MAG TPA: PEP-CTERM sorting domain-containing protein [Roseateles sp.]|uniref:PEP-CTERM sorting domain-containing protein n=1 Tax=Roseateles sp. TaxID=1971397 RepID=UPI002ED81936